LDRFAGIVEACREDMESLPLCRDDSVEMPENRGFPACETMWRTSDEKRGDVESSGLACGLPSMSPING
jgi:hypothetical protein